MFVTFEGLDGCGKSTQLQALAARLRALGLDVVATREPGGTALGERIRELALAAGATAPETELALMTASRAQNTTEVILPALQRGAWVLCDRYLDATLAYQGGGRGLDAAVIAELHRLLCHNLLPDLTLILDLDPAVSLGRARTRHSGGSEGRFEAEAQAFFQRVHRAYYEVARLHPDRCRLVQALGTVAEVGERVWQQVQPLTPQP
ncbi:MAG: dTMP kinase [Terriglobales bacterium]